jgi:hypothetical protein
MSYADWGPPPDSAAGPVLVVLAGDNDWILPNFTACRQLAKIDNDQGLDNELWDNVVQLCAGPSRPWSALWPDLRHY